MGVRTSNGTRSTRSIRNQARARLAPDLRFSACTIKARAQLALDAMQEGHETVLDNLFLNSHHFFY